MRTVIIAFQGLRGAPVRSLLVIVALTLGMLGFVAVLSGEQVMRETITQRALLVGGSETTISVSLRGPASSAEVREAEEQLRARAGADVAAAVIDDADVQVWEGPQALDLVGVRFVGAGYRDIHPLPLLSGRWNADGSTLVPRVVVNEAARDAFSSTAIRIGVADRRAPAVVIGVVRDGFDDPRVYGSLDDYFDLVTGPQTLAVQVHAPVLDQSAVKASATQLARLGERFEVLDTVRTDSLSSLTNELGTTSQVLFILAVLSLASTVVGILNVGLATAKARAKEFTLRRTMGASRGQVAALVMLESQILAVGAAVVAFAGSALLFPLVVGAFGAQAGVAPPGYDPVYGLICLVVASAAAAASSIVPALLSYRRDLSSVMRE